jgi:hypothetical protein
MCVGIFERMCAMTRAVIRRFFLEDLLDLFLVAISEGLMDRVL